MKVNGEENDDTQSQVVVLKADCDLKGWGYRHQQCLILFFCLTTAYSLRSCMGVALVAMVNPDFNTPHSIVTNSSIQGVPAKETITNNASVDEIISDSFLHSLLLITPYPKFNWNKKTQDNILSSFFFGYMLLQIPAGQFAHIFGARYMLTGALFINCVISFSLPWAAFYGGWILTCAFRFIQGLSQACIVPGMHTMLGKWTTLEERGRLAGLAYGGQALGTTIGLPITGIIAASPFGWPGIFHFYGIVTGVVGGVLWALGADSPAKHPKISATERNFIELNTGHTDINKNVKPKVPWCDILKSRSLSAIVFAHIGQCWLHLTLYSEVPAYMDKILGVNIAANGILTALPFLVMWFMNLFFSWLTDMLVVKKILSVRNTRRLANTLGSIPPSIGLVVLAYCPKNVYFVEILLITICAFKASTQVGFQINHIDISNNFSGTMISISSFVSNCFGALAPMVAGHILTDVTNSKLWGKVFFVSAGLNFFTNLIYVIFCTAEKAVWDKLPQEDVADSKEIEPMIQYTKDSDDNLKKIG